MSPLRGHREPAPDDSALVEDPKGKPVKDAPVSEPVAETVSEPVVEEKPAE